MNIGIVVDNELNHDIRVIKEIGILQKTYDNIHVLCFLFDESQNAALPGVNICRIRISRKLKNVLFFLMNSVPIYEWIWKSRIRKFIRQNAIDLLHVHDLYMSKAAGLAVRSTTKKIPIILDLHENYPYAIQTYNWTKGAIRRILIKPKAWLKKEAEYLSYATKLIVLSDSYKDDLLQQYSFLEEENIEAFPNVIDLRKFEQFKVDPSKEKDKRVTLMYFGVVAERRGIFETLEVFEDALSKGLDIALQIIGPVDKADSDRFYSLVSKPKLKSRVTHIPWIELSEMVTYMHLSDILLSPLLKNKQHESGVANKVFQYMYGAKPLIVSDCKPQKDLVESFNCGLSYSTRDEFLHCIEKLVLDKDLRKELGSNSHKKLYEKYDNSDFENILLQLYQSF